MLEKLAEIVREQAKDKNCEERIMCVACDRAPWGSEKCDKFNTERERCLTAIAHDGSIMLARWAVLLVAKGLTYEADGITPKIWTEDTMQVALMNLIAEAKEDANLSSVEEQMCQAKEDTNDY